jgi:hypothetical protein
MDTCILCYPKSKEGGNELPSGLNRVPWSDKCHYMDMKM